MTEAMSSEAVTAFLEQGFRNIELPPLSKADLDDIAGALAMVASRPVDGLDNQEEANRLVEAIRDALNGLSALEEKRVRAAIEAYRLTSVEQDESHAKR